MSYDEIVEALNSAKVEPNENGKILDFLLYYGVLGGRIDEHEYFIYGVNYDLKVLKIRAARGNDATRYVLNPAFWPAFGIDPDSTGALAPAS